MTSERRPTVTVIVPGHDVAEYAQEALDSLRAQTFRAWTAVLVDDTSTDGTGEVFDAAADRDPRFRVVHHAERAGLGAARNTGLDLVDTTYVGFLDADDRLTPDALARLVETLARTGSDFVAGAYVRLRPHGGGGYTAGTVQPWVSAATDPERVGVTLRTHPDASGNIVAWSKLSRHDFWGRTGLRFPEGALYEDQVVAQQMYVKARAFDVIPDVLVHWRERADGSSITQRKDELPVLRDYLSAMAGGIGVLDAAGYVDAAESRVQLILTMDVPPLVRIAQGHPDAAYRRLLADFVRTLHDRPSPAPRPTSEDVSAALLW
ncbi:glycosyltransferase family 2 protein [Microbacterium sp. P02]|uniref:glycosyltransferase family 2 protein n=1 Tax=unclassified Microbacterium TaxID=2609290 RepID=UPI003670D31A